MNIFCRPPGPLSYRGSTVPNFISLSFKKLGGGQPPPPPPTQAPLPARPCEDLEHVENWSKMNKMFISQTRTKSMLEAGKQLRKRLDGTEANLSPVFEWGYY